MANFLEGIPDADYGFLFHYYRAEVYRETNWRNRLDVTTNWAIGATGAILSFTFSNEAVPHSVILLNFIIVLFFLYIEARRYRFYTLLRRRTRLMERNIVAPLISPNRIRGSTEHVSTMDELSESLINPKVQMTRLEAFAWRTRRVYAILFPILFFAWVAKIYDSPRHVRTLQQAWQQGSVGVVPGALVFWIFLVIVSGLIIMAYQIPQTAQEDDLP